MNSDLFNGLFEAASALFTIGNILQTIKDQELKGMRLESILFFTSWGLFNLYFYPSHGLILSFLGGCAIVTANVVWISCILYFRCRPKPAPAIAKPQELFPEIKKSL